MDTNLHQDIGGCHGVAVMTKHTHYYGEKHWYFFNKNEAKKLFDSQYTFHGKFSVFLINLISHRF